MASLAVALVATGLAGPVHAAGPVARLQPESNRYGVAARIGVDGREWLFQLDTTGGLAVIAGVAPADAMRTMIKKGLADLASATDALLHSTAVPFRRNGDRIVLAPSAI